MEKCCLCGQETSIPLPCGNRFYCDFSCLETDLMMLFLDVETYEKDLENIELSYLHEVSEVMKESANNRINEGMSILFAN